ncbi:MAG: helix-turn-helix domain-containing protein [Clostridia bacterium]|nr:helix-turn-helix domain-containing protein [Clostridia bacterium]
METLLRTLDHLCRSLHVTVVIKDFSGQMLKTPQIAPLVSHFLLHDNPYCMQVKADRTAFRHCVRVSHRRLHEKITHAPDPGAPFWGVCHGGVREYVIPLRWRGETVIGAMIVGCFACDAARAEQSWARLADKYGLDADALAAAYDSIRRYRLPADELLTGVFTLCARYFEQLCERYMALTSAGTPDDAARESSRLELALHYIKANLRKPMTVAEIASACFCAPSTLAHLFSAATGRGVTEYILDERIALAASLLVGTSRSITDIAASCGFSSQKYFSEIFRRRRGMSPSAWRAANRNPATQGDEYP